ncbi:hypothetical protein EJB05_43096, partial [Eragrostis curvula]
MQGDSCSSLVIPCMAPALAQPVPASADEPPARRIVVAHRLPLRAAPDPNSPFGFAFSLDPDALPLQLSRGLPAAVTFVGTLPASAAAAVVPSDELDDHLMTNFSCLPVHLDSATHAAFYDTFCKRYLWPQLHCMLQLAPPGDLCFSDAAYRAFLAANRRFADRVVEALSPDDGDLVVVHDYHLWVLPTFLRRRCPRAGVGFFLHSPFPSADIFRTIAVREDLVRALLNADLVGFHTFDYAGNFLSCCSRLLGVVSSRCSRGGHVGVDYHGRTVLVKVLAVGLDMVQLRAAMASPEAVAKAKEIAGAYRGRTLVVGVDDVDRLKGVTKKMEATEKLLENSTDMRGRLVLVQINNPARSRGADADAVRHQMNQTRNRVNQRYGSHGYEPVVMIDGPVPMSVKLAYYAAADCCVVTALRDGLNRIPYFYTVCREEGPLAAAVAAADRASVAVVSEFVGSSPTLGGAVQVNPFGETAVADAMYAAITMQAEEKRARHRRNYDYVAAHDVVAWAQAFDASLQLACQDHSTMRFVGVGFGMRHRAVAFDADFKKLVPEHAGPAYCDAKRRLIVLELDEPNGKSIDRHHLLPTRETFSCVCFRWSRDDPWEVKKLLVPGFAWKETVEAVMRHYTESTYGSYIESNESAMVWHYKNDSPRLGPRQAKELFYHLEKVLAREPVSVTMGRVREIVEVNPQGVTKGVALEGLISAMARRGDAPDFVLCVGEDESLFEALAGAVDDDKAPLPLPAGSRVFTCIVGRTPRKAAFYVDEPEDALGVLRGLLATCSPRARPPPPGPGQLGLFEIIQSWE